jgi:hypothetical protein
MHFFCHILPQSITIYTIVCLIQVNKNKSKWGLGADTVLHQLLNNECLFGSSVVFTKPSLSGRLKLVFVGNVCQTLIHDRH